MHDGAKVQAYLHEKSYPNAIVMSFTYAQAVYSVLRMILIWIVFLKRLEIKSMQQPKKKNNFKDEYVNRLKILTEKNYT